MFVVAAVLLAVLGGSHLLTAVVLVALCIPVVITGLPALATWRRLRTLN